VGWSEGFDPWLIDPLGTEQIARDKGPVPRGAPINEARCVRMSNGSKKSSIEERMVEIADNPDHCFWVKGNSARETLAGYGMQRVARFELTDEQTISLFWEVEDAKKWTEVVYAQVIGDRIVRIGASKWPFGKRFGTDVDRWLTRALRGTNLKAPKWEAPAWRKALQAHSGVAEIYAHEAPKFETKTGTHSIYLSEETDLLKRHCPPFNRSKHR
jgi:hypothetical protein